jgi:hypothetical protein
MPRSTALWYRSMRGTCELSWVVKQGLRILASTMAPGRMGGLTGGVVVGRGMSLQLILPYCIRLGRAAVSAASVSALLLV